MNDRTARQATCRALAGALVVAALAGLTPGCTSSDKAVFPGIPARSPTGPEQPSPDATGPGASAPAEIVAISESDVPRAAIAVETRLRAIRSLAARTIETETIASSVDGVLESVEGLKEWGSSRDPRQQTPRELRSLGQEWRVDEETLGTWMDTTGRRLDALSAARAELRGLGERWTATEEKLEADAARPEIAERARGVLRSIREVEAQAGAELERVLILQSRISSARLDSEESLDVIAAALREQRKTLFKIESPPIWKLFGQEAAEEPIVGQVRDAVIEEGRALRQYAARAPRNLVFQLVFFVLLIVAFVRLRPESRAWPADDRGLRACARLVQRPVLGALLIALLCGMWFQPRAPLAFYEVSTVLLVVPVVILLRGVVRPAVRGALNPVAVIFIAERLWEMAWAGSLLERTALLVLTVVSAAAIAWTLRRDAPVTEAVALHWWEAIIMAGRIALAALAISLVSNIVGNVSLARLLTATVVRASYGGVVLYAAALILRGAATLLVGAAASRSVRTIARHRELILRRASLAISVIMVALFGYYVFASAGLIPLVREAVADTLMRRWGIGEVHFSISSALVFVAAIYASIVVSRVIRAVLEGDVYPRVSLPRGLSGTVTMVARYAVISLGFVLALSITGIPLDRLAIVLGAFSVGIGFGLQTVVNNFVSGLILMFERPIQVGDTIEVGGLVGRVRQIGVRASTVETFDGAEVIVPNGNLVSGQLINWTLSSRNRRIEVQVGVAYGTDPERVLALLRDATKTIPGVLAVPEPTAIFRGFGASSLDFSALFWTADFDRWTIVRSDATVKINQALADAGIEIPFPRQDVRIRE